METKFEKHREFEIENNAGQMCLLKLDDMEDGFVRIRIGSLTSVLVDDVQAGDIARWLNKWIEKETLLS